MKSIRRALLLWNTSAILIVLLAAGVIVFWLVRSGMESQFDEVLYSKFDAAIHSEAFEQLLDSTLDQATRNDAEHELTAALDCAEKSEQEENFNVQIWSGTGNKLYQSPTMDEVSQLDFVQCQQLASADEPFELDLVEGQSAWAIAIPIDLQQHFLPPDMDVDPADLGVVEAVRDIRELLESGAIPREAVVVVGRNDAYLQEHLQLIKNTLVFVGLIAISLFGMSCWFVVRQGIKPVSRLANEIESLDENSLHNRVSEDIPDELVPIADRLNVYLERLQVSVERERTFIDDAAHELRTPIAALLANQEFALRRHREIAEHVELVSESHKIAINLKDTVEHLLSLSRMESGNVQLNVESIDVNVLLKDCWKQVSTGVDAREISLDWELEDRCLVESDRILLGQVLSNVLSNSLSYTDAGGQIIVRSSTANNGVTVSIENTGCTLSPDDEERVFQRMWRGDSARSDVGKHNGLGLALCKRIMDVLQGEILAKIEPPLFSIEIRIPNR